MIDQSYMARAIELAERGLNSTSPNPRVGCVLVKDGQIIAEGFHLKAGQGHAEVEALASLVNASDAKGASAYVTLEPCSHTGRTPPCCDELISAGISRVVIGMQDPNPRVAGEGIARLEAAGIEVVTGVLENEAKALNPGFIKRMTQRLPWVRVKTAASLDGRTAMASGESQWITGPAARDDVQNWRARSCAVITGYGTLLADRPSLNVRGEKQLASLQGRQPLRVVLDSSFQSDPDTPVFTLPGESLVIGCDDSTAGYDRLQSAGVNVVTVPRYRGRVDLFEVLALLADRECNEVLVEAGSVLAGAFIDAGLVDELVLYLAPSFLGHEARPMLQLADRLIMADKVKLKIMEMRMVGDDLRIRARLLQETN